MPTYQYVCKSCGEGVEAVQGFHDAPLAECPACGGPLRKVFSSVGVVFKGSGFYRTDSRAAAKGSGSSSGGDATPAAASAPAGGAGDGSASRPAAKGSEAAPKPAKPSTPGSTSAA